jgi:hypothetical protein
LDEGWSHVGRGERVVKASTPYPTHNPIPQPVTKEPKLPPVTATKKKVTPEKAQPNTSAAPKKADVKPKKAASTGANPISATLVLANPPAV